MDQTPPRTKKEWKKWARRQVTWDTYTWSRSFSLQCLYRYLNEVIWDRKKKGVVVTEQAPYKELVRYFTNEDGTDSQASPPRAVYCEATRIMNGGQLPHFIRESLEGAGWDPDKCCKILSDKHKRPAPRPDIESESEAEDSEDSSESAAADQVSERSPSPDTATDDESSQASRSSSESIENSPQGRSSTTSTSTFVSTQHIPYVAPEIEPKKHQEWMEWAKRQKNPAFKGTPESATLDEVLEAADWQYKDYPWGRPKLCKWQQPYKHLMGRWGYDGEAGPNDTPSAVDLEATRIINKGTLPNDICEWLANAGWDAEKCCNPALTPSEKRLSAKFQNTTPQPEQSLSDDDEQHNTTQEPDSPLPNHELGQPEQLKANDGVACSSTKLIGPEKWKQDARAQKNPKFASYPYEDSRLNSYIDEIEWSGLRNKPRRIDRQKPYRFLGLQFGPKYTALHREVPPAGACEAVRIISKLNDSEFPVKLCEILAKAGWDAIKCCDPSLPSEQKKLHAAQDTGPILLPSDDDEEEEEEEITPEHDRLRNIQQAMKSDIEKRTSQTTSDGRQETTSREPNSPNTLKRPLVKEEKDPSPEPKRFKSSPEPIAHSSTTKTPSISPLTSSEDNHSKTLSVRDSSNTFSSSPSAIHGLQGSPWGRRPTQVIPASRSRSDTRSNNGARIHHSLSSANRILEDDKWQDCLTRAFSSLLQENQTSAGQPPWSQLPTSNPPQAESTANPVVAPSNVTKPATTPANVNVPPQTPIQEIHTHQANTPSSPPIKTSPKTEQNKVITVPGDVDLTLQNAAASIAAALDAQRRQREDEERRVDERRRAADDFRQAAERIERTSGALGEASRNLRNATEILKNATRDLEEAEAADKAAREAFDAVLGRWRGGLT